MQWIKEEIATPKNEGYYVVVAFKYNRNEPFIAYWNGSEWHDPEIKLDSYIGRIDFWNCVSIIEPPKQAEE